LSRGALIQTRARPSGRPRDAVTVAKGVLLRESNRRHRAVVLLAVHPVLLQKEVANAEPDVRPRALAVRVGDGVGRPVRAFALLRVLQTVAVVPRVTVGIGQDLVQRVRQPGRYLIGRVIAVQRVVISVAALVIELRWYGSAIDALRCRVGAS
jgi:hypothetical protein